MKKLLFILFILISTISFSQFQNNNPTYFNVNNYGAKADGITDATASIQAAITACVNAGGGTVYFPYSPNYYKISGALQTSVSSVNPNCQIYIPLVQASSHQVSVKLLGGTAPPYGTEDVAGLTRNTQGIILFSTIQGTGTTPAILGSPWYSAGAVGNRNYIDISIENMEFRTQTRGVTNNDTLGTLSGINGSKFLTFSFDQLHISTSSPVDSSVKPTNETYGIIMPDVNNHARMEIGSAFIEGYKYGLQTCEHMNADHITVIGCVNGLKVVNGFHTAVIRLGTFEADINSISLQGTQPLSIVSYETEHVPTGKWFVDSTDIIQVSGGSRVQIFNSGVVNSSFGVVDSFKTSGNPNYVVYNGQGGFKYVPFGDNTNFRLNQDSNFVWDNTNKNLGLGTTTPNSTNRLHLYGSSAIGTRIETSNSGNEAFQEYWAGGSKIGITEAFGSTFANGAFQNALAFTSNVNNTGNIQFLTTTSSAVTSRMKINNSGTVTIGSYTLPSASSTQYAILSLDGSSNASWGYPTNLGIGGSPTWQLDVKGSTGATIGSFTCSNSSGEAGLIVASDAGNFQVENFGSAFGNSALRRQTIISTAAGLTNGMVFATNASAPLAFRTNASSGQGNERMTILGGGNVGINNTAPTSTLQVTGSFALAYVAKTANYTAGASDQTVEFTANSDTLTLPTAVGITGRIYTIVNSGAGTITIATTSSQTFVNVVATPTTLSLATVGFYSVESNGAGYMVIAH